MYHLQSISLSSPATSINFNSIPTQFNHLQIRMSGRTNRGSSTMGYIYLRFNGDTGNNYSTRNMYGQGSSVSGEGYSSQPYIFAGLFSGDTGTANCFGVSVIDILEYTKTDRNKTIKAISGYNQNTTDSNSQIRAMSGSWMNLNSITSISLFEVGGNSFQQYSKFDLYGISTSSQSGA
jgi:hypothetical protein